jgi:hypothetical protein
MAHIRLREKETTHNTPTITATMSINTIAKQTSGTLAIGKFVVSK